MSIEIIHDEPIGVEGFHNFDVFKIRATNNIRVWWRCINCDKQRYRDVKIQHGKCEEVVE